MNVQALTYSDSGIDIDQGNQFIDDIKSTVQSTYRSEVISSIGGFNGAFRLPAGYKKPVLISATDGVGTKLRLAIDHQNFSSVGIDLVAMCVNDLVVSGAEPLFFLDYYATGKLDRHLALQIVEGISEGCRQAGCALIGGETAEMPGMYMKQDFDLAGFCTGIVEEEEIIDGSKVKAGDVLIGLKSNGVHSNGYSLVRKILDQFNEHPTSIVQTLLVPTRIYVKPILALKQKVNITGMSHITGGGITENLPRILPKGLDANVDTTAWELPSVFQWLQHQGNVKTAEMRRVFNCGVGMIITVPHAQVQQALQCLTEQGESAFVMGSVVDNGSKQVNFL